MLSSIRVTIVSGGFPPPPTQGKFLWRGRLRRTEAPKDYDLEKVGAPRKYGMAWWGLDPWLPGCLKISLVHFVCIFFGRFASSEIFLSIDWQGWRPHELSFGCVLPFPPLSHPFLNGITNFFSQKAKGVEQRKTHPHPSTPKEPACPMSRGLPYLLVTFYSNRNRIPPCPAANIVTSVSIGLGGG